MIERSDKRKTRFEGFFITRGEIERTEEMLPGFSPEKPRKPAAAPKRKPAEGGGFDSGSDFQNAPPPPKVTGMACPAAGSPRVARLCHPRPLLADLC